MNIMNGSLKGRVYEGLEEKTELASAVSDRKRPVYRVGFVEDVYMTDSTRRDYSEMKKD